MAPTEHAGAIALNGEDVAVFASDSHLGGNDRKTAELFLRTLAEEARRATHVFLLGDLFDAWVGDDRTDELARGLVRLLSALACERRRVYVMRGNRDFLLDVAVGGVPAQFAAQSGATMLADPSVVHLFGVPALLVHGDALCTDDYEYQRFRALVRSHAWQQEFLARPPDERSGIARELRARSELSKAEKIDYLMDVNQASVAAAMRAAGARLLVHGHTHRAARHRFDLDGAPAERWVLPDWDAGANRGGVLRASASGLEFVGACASGSTAVLVNHPVQP